MYRAIAPHDPDEDPGRRLAEFARRDRPFRTPDDRNSHHRPAGMPGRRPGHRARGGRTGQAPVRRRDQQLDSQQALDHRPRRLLFECARHGSAARIEHRGWLAAFGIEGPVSAGLAWRTMFERGWLGDDPGGHLGVILDHGTLAERITRAPGRSRHRDHHRNLPRAGRMPGRQPPVSFLISAEHASNHVPERWQSLFAGADRSGQPPRLGPGQPRTGAGPGRTLRCTDDQRPDHPAADRSQPLGQPSPALSRNSAEAFRGAERGIDRKLLATALGLLSPTTWSPCPDRSSTSPATASRRCLMQDPKTDIGLLYDPSRPCEAAILPPAWRPAARGAA